MTQPASTYRVQLRAGTDLDAVTALVPYLHELGVDWLYLPPVFAARQGSTHGYDVIDPTAVEPALGGRDALERLAAAARQVGMGILLDIVPNHQAASSQNPRWAAMLRDGPDSGAARWFDVDWSGRDGVPPGTLVWPLLREELDEEIAQGALALDTGPDGAPALRYHGETLPVVACRSDDIRDVLEAQHYRLVHWRTGGQLRNYRCFFDVTDLVGVRVEDDDVLRASHELVRELVVSDTVQGLRIDHVDGLVDPGRYLHALTELAGAPRAPYVVVEKILSRGEELPDGWPVAGTTGYEIGDALGALLVDPEGRAALEARLVAEIDGVRFPTVERRAKREVLFGLFQAEWRAVTAALDVLAGAAGVRAPGDLAEALASITVALPVYRTYCADRPAGGDDRRRIEEAATAAAGEAASDADTVAAVARLLLGDGLDPAAPRAELVRRWQQLTGAVMAKGREDTACYRYPALLAQAEVGGDPGDDVHDAVARFERRVAGHRGLVTTSTHDTKRSEDVRARIAVLSERADAFEAGLARWRGLVRPRPGVTPAEQRFVAQTLLGAWPLEAADLPDFGERLAAYLTKALREAKQGSSWLHPSPQHESDVIDLARRSIEREGRRLRRAFGELVDDVAFFGVCNSLAQLTWKLALPGTVDVYRGCELWDLSLVDPDNRRPVDYDARRALLASSGPGVAGDEWRSPRRKLWLTTAGLRARGSDPDLFVAGDLVPVAVEGAHREHVVAFARRHGSRWALALAPRLATRIVPRFTFPVGHGVWHDTRLALPAGAPTAWYDELGARRLEGRGSLEVGAVLATLPGALLVSDPAASR